MTQGRHKLSMLERRHGRSDETAIAVDDGFVTMAVVDDISPDGIAKIVVSGETVPREALSLLKFSSGDAASEALLGRTVIVLVNPNTQPVILGAVADRLWDKRDADQRIEAQANLPTAGAVAVQLDKRCLDLEASEEIRLTCGKSSLVLRRDGTVIVRGVKIVSRATETNKIRGATVSIN